MRSRLWIAATLALVGPGLMTACHTAPTTQSDKDDLHQGVLDTLREMKANDSSLERFLADAYGYVVFPEVGKGGLLVGGAYGHGEVFEQGRLVGYCDLSQGSVGLQAGGQTYGELIVFQTRDALERFKRGELTFAANASAVAIHSGASAAAKYDNGVAVFTMPKGGLMFEASVGGQRFTYQAIE